MSQVAFLGAGAMGLRMAQNLLNAKHQVVVYNRTADKVKPLVKQGAIYAPTPREAAEQADVVMSMVTDDEASRAIWLTPQVGALYGLRPGAIAIESSTVTVNWVKELETSVEPRGAAFLDAPVVGSRPQAEAGTLIYLVGGDAEVLAHVQPILHLAGGSTVHHLGGVGQGIAMKLAVNALFGIQVVALAEILGMLNRQGLSSVKAMECLRELPVMSPAAKGAGALMQTHNHAPLFPIHLVEKDFRYALQLAEAGGVSMPVTAVSGEIYQRAIALGFGDDNITGVAQLWA